MMISRRDFLGYSVAGFAVACSGDIGSAAPPATPTARGTGSLGAAGSSLAGANGAAGNGGGAGGAGPVSGVQGVAGAFEQNRAGANQLVQPATALRGVLRGRVITTPAQASQHAVICLMNGPLDKVIDTKVDDLKLNFVPYVSVMTVGGTMTYLNHHPFPDSIFSTSEEKFDLGMVEAHGTRKRRFEKAGIYTLLCHIHPNQVGFLVVSPSSSFARADKKGAFVLEDIPVGDYEVMAWAPRVRPERQNVTISGNEATLEFRLKR